jgi:hypothetical protein
VRLAAVTAYGSAANLNWRINEKRMEPHILLIDKSKWEGCAFTRCTFEQASIYICPALDILNMTGKIMHDNSLLYRASKPDCDAMSLAPSRLSRRQARSRIRSILASARSVNRLLTAREVVDANGGSDVARCLCFPIFKRRAGGIGDAIDSVEETRHRSGIDQCGRAKGREQRSARLDKGEIVIAERRLSEPHKVLAMNNAAISDAVHDNREIEDLA